MAEDRNMMEIAQSLRGSIFEYAREIAEKRGIPAALAIGVRLEDGSFWCCGETLNTEDTSLYLKSVKKLTNFLLPWWTREEYDRYVRAFHHPDRGGLVGFSAYKDVYAGVCYFEGEGKSTIDVEQRIKRKFFIN
jgi:hypothetical protein